MQKTKLYRRRFIPDETVELKDDRILRQDEDLIITKWNTLKPRTDFSHGVSVYFLKRGWKVSRFFDEAGNCVYTYCDIIEPAVGSSENSILIMDLLVDIIVYNDGFVKVVDLNELSDALDGGLIPLELAKKALRLTDELLHIIYTGRLPELTACLEGLS